MIIRMSLLMFFSLSISVLANASEHLEPQSMDHVSEVRVLGDLEVSGFEVRQISFTSISGELVDRELLLMYGPAGVDSALQSGVLPFSEYNRIMGDFGLSHSFTNRPVSTLPNQINPDESALIIVDVEVMNLNSQAEADALIARYNIEVDMEHDIFLDQESLESSYGDSCPRGWRCRTRDFVRKGLGFDFDESVNLHNSNYANADLRVSADGELDASVVLDYRYRRRFGIPYRVRVDYVTAGVSYNLSGDFLLTGEAQRTFEGREHELFQSTIFNRVFMVGIVPVWVDVKTYFRVGTGDLILEAAGQIGLHQPLEINGSARYLCDADSCKEESNNHSNLNAAFSSANLSAEVSAKATIEPYLNAAIRGRIYRGTIVAEVGLQPSIRAMLRGYTGNNCGDADKDGTNEWVNGLTLSADFRVGSTWRSRFLLSQVPRRYYEIKNFPLGYIDLLSPSSALSPSVSYEIDNSQLALRVYPRSCSRELIHDKFQNFTIYWGDGDGQSEVRHDHSGGTVRRIFDNLGSYTLRVVHESGADTTIPFHISSTAPPVVRDPWDRCNILPGICTITEPPPVIGPPCDGLICV